jgi:hypothetical protein
VTDDNGKVWRFPNVNGDTNAFADAPVKSLHGEKGRMYLNDKPMVIDDLWANGTAPAAYWLWSKCFLKSPLASE